MKNFIVCGLVAICAVVMTGDEALATGGGGGKTKSRARVVFRNTEPAAGEGIAVWVRPVGTALPATLGQLRSQLIFAGPGETRSTNQLKNGAYEVSSVLARDTVGPANTPLTPAAVAGLVIGSTQTNINGVDRTFNVNSAALTATN